VPVRVRGTYEIWPAGKGPRLFAGGRSKPSLRFGAPLTFSDLKSSGTVPAQPTADQIAEAIREIIRKMA
jgi:hypothetical protein